MRGKVLALALLAALGVSACQPKAPPTASACPDDGPTFPGTNTCVGRSVNYMDQDALAALPQPREGCTWAPNQTMLGDTEALLYMSATCKSVATTLAFADGKVTYATGDFAGPDQIPLIEIFEAPENDALAPVRAKLAALPPAEQAGCVIQSAGLEGPLAGAVVIGPTAAVRAKAPKDEPNSYCGPYGLDEGSQSFWLVRQGKAMFFQLGQEQADIAPVTVTLMRKDAEANWAAADFYARGPLAECLLQVGAKTYLDGVCEASKSEDGSFQVFGKDYFAYAGKLDGGKFNVSWNEAPENTHAGAVLGEDFVQSGDCLTGAKGKVCLWDLGKRPTK